MTTTLAPYAVSQVMTDYRNSAATYINNAGVLTDALINSLLLSYDPSLLTVVGYSCREQRANILFNSRAVGAVPGTPGTDPTNWSMNVAGSTLVKAVVGSGVDSANGWDYADINVSGTTASVGPYNVYYDVVAGQPVVAGTTYTMSAAYALVGGSFANVNIFNLVMTWINSSGTTISTSSSTSFVPTSSPTRQSFSAVAPAGAVAVRPTLKFTVVAASTINFTLRHYNPQIEAGNFFSSVIRPAVGATGATTRSADDIRMSLQSAWMDGVSNTFLVEAAVGQAAPSGQDQGLFRVDDGTDANKFCIVNIAGTLNIHAQLTIGGTLESDINLGAMTAGVKFRAVAGYSMVNGSGLITGLISGGNWTSGAPTIPSVPAFTRALVGRSSLNAGTFAANGATHLNGHISEIMIAKGTVLSQDAMLYLSQMNITVGALLSASGVILGS
jgi:hypothetical protein